MHPPLQAGYMSGFNGGGDRRWLGPIGYLGGANQNNHPSTGASQPSSSAPHLFGGSSQPTHDAGNTAWSQRSIRPDTASTVDERVAAPPPPIDPSMQHFNQHGPWFDMCRYLGLTLEGSWVQTLRKAFGCTVADVIQGMADLRVEKLACVITAISHTLDGSVSVTLMDPTGKVNGYVHTDLIEEYGPELAVGSVVVLSKVAIFLSGPGVQRWLNIVPNNVIGFYPKRLDAVASSTGGENGEMYIGGGGGGAANAAAAAAAMDQEEDQCSVMMHPVEAEGTWMEEDDMQDGGFGEQQQQHHHHHYPPRQYHEQQHSNARMEGDESQAAPLGVSFGWDSQQKREEAISILGSTTAFDGNVAATMTTTSGAAKGAASISNTRLPPSGLRREIEAADIWGGEAAATTTVAAMGADQGDRNPASSSFSSSSSTTVIATPPASSIDGDFSNYKGDDDFQAPNITRSNSGTRPIPFSSSLSSSSFSLRAPWSSREVSATSSSAIGGGGGGCCGGGGAGRAFTGPSSYDSLNSMVAQPDESFRGAWDYYDDDDDDLGDDGSVGGGGGGGGGHHQHHHPGGGSMTAGAGNRFFSTLHSPSPTPFHRSTLPMRMPTHGSAATSAPTSSLRMGPPERRPQQQQQKMPAREASSSTSSSSGIFAAAATGHMIDARGDGGAGGSGMATTKDVLDDILTDDEHLWE